MNTYPSPVVKPLYRLTQIIWYLFYLIEIILVFRFILKLLGANTGAPFTQFVYDISYPFVAPFLYVVPSPRIEGALVEWSTLLALLVYWVVAWVLVTLLLMAKPVSRLEAHQKLEEEHVE